MKRALLISLTFLMAGLVGGPVGRGFSNSGTPETLPASRKPVIHVSQIGYGADEQKWCVVEVVGTPAPRTAVLERYRKGQWRAVAKLNPGFSVFRYGSTMTRYDFSSVKKSALYRISIGERNSIAFAIGATVYQDLYADTVSQFFSGQMCHIAMRVGEELRHGICHADDAAQVAPNKVGPDYYRSFESTETGVKPGTHFAVNYGGWHDAGDNDLNVSSHAFTLLLLSWASLDMRANADNATVDFIEQKVKYGAGNGVPDIQEQIRWGAEWMLRVQRADGGVPIGVVEVSKKYYGLYKLPDRITDGKIGTEDDRELYTNAVSENQLKFAASMAAASKALRHRYPLISEYCIEAAERAWRFYLDHPNVWRATAYNTDPTSGKEGMILSTVAELFMATGKGEYRDRLIASMPQMEEMDRYHLKYMEPTINWFALPHLIRASRDLPEIAASVKIGLRRWHEAVLAQEKTSAFAIDERFEDTRWGISVRPMGIGAIYALAEHYFPEVVESGHALRYFRFLFGMHQGPDYSFVVGKGSRTPQYPHSGMLSAIFGKKPGGISGAVVPGIRLSKKGRVEYRDKRDLYEFNEPTIASGALFVYNALAIEGKWR